MAQILAAPNTFEVQAPIAAQVSRPRSMIIDVVRGIAITLVALGHTDQGVGHRGWWGSSPVGDRIDATIYAFHMPAFFFISGIFLCASVEKRGQLRFTVDKLRTMIWPYLFFSVLNEFVIQLFPRFTVQQTLAPSHFLFDIATGSLSWFLPTIFFVVILGMLARKLPMPVLFLLAVAVSTWYPQTPIVFVTRGLKFLPFLVLGMWVGRSYEKIERIPLWVASSGFLGLALLVIASTWPFHPDTNWRFLPLGILGTMMLLLLARVLGRSAPARFFAWTGEASVGIFLLAAYFQGTGRELLFRLLHITNPWLQMLFPTLLAVAIPAWIYQHRDRFHIAWTFVFPYNLSQPEQTQASR
jgi:fucose 4-O-acetylase-like acetyltransferase